MNLEHPATVRADTGGSHRPRRGPWLALAAVLLLAAAVAAYLAFVRRPAFDPDAVAAAETRMWKSYYSRDRLALGMELVRLLRSQFGLTAAEARAVGGLLAGAAMKFKAATGDYESIVLPDLVAAYEKIRRFSGRGFDAKEAARAELAWWVDRRAPGRNTPEQIGEGMAKLYAVLYGQDAAAFHQAGRLRAQATHLRDVAGAGTDWAAVEDLLRQSYESLAKDL